MERRSTEIYEQKRLAELLERMTEYRKSIKEERSKLWHSEKDSQGQYKVWDRLEILSFDIEGYTSVISSGGYTRKEPHEVISHLHKLSIFNVECIMNWYPCAAQEYPKIKEFFELLDYLRLLAIEYIERYRLQESKPE